MNDIYQKTHQSNILLCTNVVHFIMTESLDIEFRARHDSGDYRIGICYWSKMYGSEAEKTYFRQLMRPLIRAVTSVCLLLIISSTYAHELSLRRDHAECHISMTQMMTSPPGHRSGSYVRAYQLVIAAYTILIALHTCYEKDWYMRVCS